MLILKYNSHNRKKKAYFINFPFVFFSFFLFSIVNNSFEFNSDILILQKNSSLNKKTGDSSPVQIQLLKIKPTHRWHLLCNH